MASGWTGWREWTVWRGWTEVKMCSSDYNYKTAVLMVVSGYLVLEQKKKKKKKNVSIIVKRPLMMRWIVGSILYGVPIELFSFSTTGITKAVICANLSMG